MKTQHQQEIEERTFRRLDRYVKSLPPEKRTLTADEIYHLMRQGLVNGEGGLTDSGLLKLHQLELFEWMSKSPRFRKQSDTENKSKVEYDEPESGMERAE